jgi:glycosyltransferase involved in cell wall biosynthesis
MTTTTAPSSRQAGQAHQQGRRYAVITPCRNEAEFLPITIKTMVAQTVQPAVWLIVDDGSTDETPQIIEAAAREHPWIRMVRRKDRGARAVGGGVVEAFNDGLATINLHDYDYVCKLDADLGLPEVYFERLMERMEADPRLGNFSGKTYIPTKGGKWVSERMGDENAIGASKFYRIECFRQIGGFVAQTCWDGIDGHRCRMLGWKAMSIDHQDLRMRHYRPQGSSQQSIWVGRKRWGRGKYFMGSSPFYVLAVAGFRMLERPFVLGGLGILAGYVEAWRDEMPRYGDRSYLKHLRRYEMASLVFGKRRTMERFHARLDSSGDPDSGRTRP